MPSYLPSFPRPCTERNTRLAWLKRAWLELCNFIWFSIEYNRCMHVAAPPCPLLAANLNIIPIGCPTILAPLCFLLFSCLLLYQNIKAGWVLKNSGNLLSDRHQNFENWFTNSWDNWRQRWHPSFRNWHFTITQTQNNNFGVVGGNFDVNYLI